MHELEPMTCIIWLRCLYAFFFFDFFAAHDRTFDPSNAIDANRLTNQIYGVPNVLLVLTYIWVWVRCKVVSVPA